MQRLPHIALFFLLALTVSMRGQAAVTMPSAEAAFSEAVSAYQQGRFAEAYAGFTEAARMAQPAPAALYHNAGNAAYAAGDFPAAALNFRQALEVDPAYEPAQRNLALTEKAAAALEGSLDSGTPLAGIRADWLVLATMFTFWLGLGFVVFCLGGLVLRRGFRTASALMGVLLLAIALGLGVITTRRVSEEAQRRLGVVMQPAGVYAGVSNSGSKLADLPPATSLLLLSRRGDSFYARLPGGREGWVAAEAIGEVARPGDPPVERG